MAEHASVSEIEGEAKKLKRDLEGWREIILPLNSILLWEKNSYLGVILVTTTVSFFLLWRMNPSILTLVSLLGIVITVADYLVPTAMAHFSHPDKWTSTQERQLESICKTLAANKVYITNWFKSFYQMRKDRPSYYYTIVIVTLLTLSWIGNVVNNLFLTYLIVTGLLLLPGAQKRGLMAKYASQLNKIILDKVKGGGDLKLEKKE